MTRHPQYGLLMAFALVLAGCVAPFSDYQDARLVGPGRYELTPSFSRTLASDEGETETAQDEFGLHFATGIHEAADFRARYHLVKVGDDYVHVLAAGPKFGLVPDRFALDLPVGLGFGSGIETGETASIHPTALFTVPASEELDFNFSVKSQLFFDDMDDPNFGFNAGLGIRAGDGGWVVRPEGGVLVNPGSDGRFWHFGVGLTRILEGG